MDFEASNKFNYDMGKLCEKYGIRKAVGVFHPGGHDFRDVESVYIGDPSVEWILDSFAMVGREIEKRMKAHELNSCGTGIPKVENK